MLGFCSPRCHKNQFEMNKNSLFRPLPTVPSSCKNSNCHHIRWNRSAAHSLKMESWEKWKINRLRTSPIKDRSAKIVPAQFLISFSQFYFHRFPHAAFPDETKKKANKLKTLCVRVPRNAIMRFLSQYSNRKKKTVKARHV